MVMLACSALAAIPWLVYLRSRLGGLISLVLVTLAAPTLLILLMVLARATGAPLVASLLSVVILAAATGAALRVRSGAYGRARDAVPLRDVLPAGLGALVALGTFLAGRFLPGAPRVSWAMLGDSASQLVEARLIIGDGGLTPPPMVNPVPLTAAIVAAVAAPGRPATGAGATLAHDLGTYASTWAALIVLSCVLAGAIGYAVVKHSSRLVGIPARVTVAATSLLPLGWFWTGYPVKFGFINAHVAFVLLLASILGCLCTRRRLAMGVAIQLLAIVLTLLTWSPLAVLPAALAVTQALGALRSVAKWSRRARATGFIVALAGFGCALWLGIPMLQQARGSLRVAGGLAEFPKPMLALAAVTLIALTLAASARVDWFGLGIIVLSLASLGGLAMVLLLSGEFSGPWTYYPHKYAWIATAVLLTVALPQGACAVARLRSARVRALFYGAAALAVAGSLGLGSWWAPGYLRFLGDSLPYVILVEDNLPDEGQSPDAVADAVIARVGLPRLTVPWESSLANDYRAGFWLIQLRRETALSVGDVAVSDALWPLANFHESPADLCTLAEVVPEGLTVQTANGALAGEIQKLCPAADLVVVGDPLAGSAARNRS
jgi:hypothetical protein